MITFSLFGAGRIGHIHANNLLHNSEARLKHIVDINSIAAYKLGTLTGAKVSDAKSAITDPEIDAVIIASPTNTHAELIIESARNRKAIFCEKPIDLDVNKVKSCIDIVEQYGVSCALGFNRRFDPNFVKLKTSLQKGIIGKLEVLSIISRDPYPPPIDYLRTSGGLFRDMMIHDLDMARWLCEEDPIEIYASASTMVNQEIALAGDVDTAVVILKMASGKLCHISNSRRSVYGYDQRIEAFGSKGSIQVNNLTETSISTLLDSGILSAKPMNFFIERYEKSFKQELYHFIDCIKNKKQLSVTHIDGEKAIKLADAAYLSWKKRRPIYVDFK